MNSEISILESAWREFSAGYKIIIKTKSKEYKRYIDIINCGN